MSEEGRDQPPNKWQNHLGWTSKQGRILTDSGNAMNYYCEENGFPFSEEELPHHHLERGDSHEVFQRWAKQTSLRDNKIALGNSPIIGAWNRPLFTGKWEHSTDADEIVYNVQTGTLFVDLRIPRSKPISSWEKMGLGMERRTKHETSRRILESMSDEDLRIYARQHVFGGFSMTKTEHPTKETKILKNLPICTRHHCIDWNYVPSKPRPRPNKWYIEGKFDDAGPCNVWKEWSYSLDGNGQCYYWERWERINGDDAGKGLRLALRKRPQDEGNDSDGIIVVIGDHFNYIMGRQFTGNEKPCPNANNLVEMVDNVINQGDRQTAISYLTLDGGHGTVSSGWKIDCAIQPWRHGSNVFECVGNCGGEDNAFVKVIGDGQNFFEWKVAIDDALWDVYECSIDDAKVLEELINGKNFGRGNQSSRL